MNFRNQVIDDIKIDALHDCMYWCVLDVVTVVSDATYSKAFVSKLHKDGDGHGSP